jgi:hypothetical protein
MAKETLMDVCNEILGRTKWYHKAWDRVDGHWFFGPFLTGAFWLTVPATLIFLLAVLVGYLVKYLLVASVTFAVVCFTWWFGDSVRKYKF